ncbi:barstar family protein [Streptomyces sp. NPDC047028]|uniref:barstar family protein n=1 Tax=Streptomyces sp. NPDC047028 TaxID=3155793 RepID=UPI0033FFF065
MSDGLTGRHVATLDLTGVTDKAGLMDRVARDLALPAWFGRNWDALADSLSDPTVWPGPAGDSGLLLVVLGWQGYAAARPEEWETARDVFTQAMATTRAVGTTQAMATTRAMRTTPALTVALALGGSS